VVESFGGSDFCILVTEPTPFGLNDLVLAVETVRELNIPCGVVMNRVGVDYQDVEKYCREQNIPIMLTIPLDTEIARLYSRGIALVEGIPHWKPGFTMVIDGIREILDERNRSTKR